MNLITPEIVGLCGLVISLVSVRLHWGLQRRLEHIEDMEKDGRIGANQAAPKIRFWKSFVPALSLTGVALMIWAASSVFA